MTIKLNLSDSELWHMLQEKGYTISLERVDETTIKVTCNGKFSVTTYSPSHSYSTDFKESEIIRDMLPHLLKWTGLKPRIVLDY